MRVFFSLVIMVLLLSQDILAQQLVIKPVQASILGSQSLYPDNDWKESSDVSIKVALMSEFLYNQTAVFYGRIAWLSYHTMPIQYFLDKNYGGSNGTTLRLGRFGTPTAFLNREHPFLPASHFEPMSLKKMSHSDHGILLIRYTDMGRFYGGAYYNYKRGKVEYHVAWSSNNKGWRQKTTKASILNLTAYIVDKNVYAGATSIVFQNHNGFKTTIKGYAETDSLASFYFEMNPIFWGTFYVDLVHSFKQKKTDWEIGWTKEVLSGSQNRSIFKKVLFGLAYHETHIIKSPIKMVSITLWIHS